MSNKGLREYLTYDRVKLALIENGGLVKAARFLNVSPTTLKKYTFKYFNEDGRNFYETYVQRQFIRKGPEAEPILKEIREKNANKPEKSRIKYKIEDILAGKVKMPTTHLRRRLVNAGLKQNKCDDCGFCEKRDWDNKIPLIVVFSDGDRKNWSLDNIEFLCHNCYYLRGYNQRGRNGFQKSKKLDLDKLLKDVGMDGIDIQEYKDMLQEITLPK